MMINRLKQLQAQFKELRIDAFLVTNTVNKAYLTGFDGDGVVLVTANQTYVITDSRYETALAAIPHDFDVIITRYYLEAAAQQVKKRQITVLGFEDSIPFHDYDRIDELMSSDIVPMTNLIEQMREVKSEDELQILGHACKMTIKGFNTLLPLIKPGVYERHLANQLDAIMRDLGAERASFDTIVASGKRAALPHGAATSKAIQKGEMITIDFGYEFDGYTSDLTRTVALGDPGEKLKAVYRVVQQAQQVIINAVKPGVSGHQLDQVGREFITSAGYGKYFNHGTGHGIGLDIHEGPALSMRSNDHMMTNNVITVEPGIYLPDLGGIRIEDDILVTEAGHRILTDGSTDLVVL
ncbi:aminopeptidase P family protein [Lactobacillus sp. LC28-10]|uniref:Aminopeptidase P family protein n=1 Tax=Secundilactobacillus angelensis TaxID=2722706 RepID=A0ABX1KZ56_9LACO|nr:aminopeptidase P family protein [Secundilactobacillus angelensis]MCH5463290.1 aminopeptidase P family protein [Secundilactobacillus angelensis]NLR19226.1 aminopeptidase P family protein [Secundilactobacillus angelensis]